GVEHASAVRDRAGRGRAEREERRRAGVVHARLAYLRSGDSCVARPWQGRVRGAESPAPQPSCDRLGPTIITEMPKSVAITRAVSGALGACELTHLERVAIDVELARAQHRTYEGALIEAGYLVERLDTSMDMPDSGFVEDIAIVFDELAILTRPGAESRRRESAAVAEA